MMGEHLNIVDGKVMVGSDIDLPFTSLMNLKVVKTVLKFSGLILSYWSYPPKKDPDEVLC